MSIYAYTGMPGCGKSYNAVEQVILPALREGRRVVTNVPLYADKIRETVKTGEIVEFPVQAVAQDPESIRTFVTAGCVFVLDEVWRLWPAGEKANKVPEPFKSLLAEHRHMVDAAGNSVSIVLLVQDLANIGSFARRLVEQTFIHTKLTHVGASKRYRVDIFHGPVTGATGPQSNRLREIFGTYKPEVYAFYQSHTMSAAQSDGANEKHVDSRGNVLKRPMLIIGALAVPALIAYGIYGLSHFVQSKTSTSPSAAVSGSTVSRSSSSVSASPVAPFSRSTPQESVPPAWRVLGWVLNPSHPENSRAMMRSSTGLKQIVEFAECRKIDKQPMQCRLEGFWYSETGRTWPDEHHEPLAALPVGANNVAM